MKRVLVLGSGGAGKTTVARRLAERTGLPLVHLDRYYWNAGWEPTPDHEWRDVVQELVAEDRWIMDGHFGGTLDVRLEAADTVAFLDTPRLTCLVRVVRRWLTYRNRSRPSLPDGCPERVDLEFLSWIWTYPVKTRPQVLEKLDRVRATKEVFVLRGPREIRAFLGAADT